MYDRNEAKKRVDFYKSIDRDRSQDTLHGAFLDICIHSDDPDIAAVSARRVEDSLCTAEELGIKGVVFHANFLPELHGGVYQYNWIERNETFWRKKLNEHKNIEIYLENMFEWHPDAIVSLAERMTDEPRFGLCLDYSHMKIYGSDARRWMSMTAPYVRHLHVNDTDLETDGHLRVGTGKIDWEEFSLMRREYMPDVSCLIEVREIEDQRASLEYLINRFWHE